MQNFRSPKTHGQQGEQLWSIRDVATHYGVTLRALRFYEDRGLIHSQRDGSSRLYDARTRSRLEVILKGKQLGFTLTEIRDLIEVGSSAGSPVFQLALEDEQILGQIEMLKAQRASIDRAIEELRETQSRRSPAGVGFSGHSPRHSA
jgi:DNA-binding transcriptional MerR regulator